MSKGTDHEAQKEGAAIDEYVKANDVDQTVEEMISALLKAKPENPRQWLLNKLEKDLSDETDELSESDLHKLFAVTRRITSEIVPMDTINMVISETMQILNCDIVSLFVLEKKSGMLLLYASNLANPIRVSPGQGIAGAVFNGKRTVNIPDCYKDRRFDKSFDRKTGYVTRSLLAIPIVDYEGNTCGVIQAINKLPTEPVAAEVKESAGVRAIPFQRNDEKLLMHLAQHVAIAMRNADVYREAISTSERATGLLNTIQSLSQDLGTQSLLLTITMHANKIVSAERSTVFLVDEQHQQLWSVSTDTGQEIRIPKHAGIAGQCCAEGIVINIPDAYADGRFNQAIDKKTGFKTQSILALPMFNQDEAPGENGGRQGGMPNVIGVIQMINKVSYDGTYEFFDEADVEIMESFAKFVGPKLTNSAMLNTKRSNDMGAGTEAEMGLRKVSSSLTNCGTGGGGQQSPSTGKRSSCVGQMDVNFVQEAAICEEDEEDDDA